MLQFRLCTLVYSDRPLHCHNGNNGKTTMVIHYSGCALALLCELIKMFLYLISLIVMSEYKMSFREEMVNIP
uniref:Uncharacterized protein n=1 Tax=Anguilla anguilla TaxID=7936 RepID=A0A0E9WVK7_ANGAN